MKYLKVKNDNENRSGVILKFEDKVKIGGEINIELLTTLLVFTEVLLIAIKNN